MDSTRSSKRIRVESLMALIVIVILIGGLISFAQFLVKRAGKEGVQSECLSAPATHYLLCPAIPGQRIPVYLDGGTICAEYGGTVMVYDGCVTVPIKRVD